MLLDVTRLPRQALYGPEENAVDLAATAAGLREAVDSWAQTGYVKKNTSCGFAAAHPDSFSDWDDPYKSTWFVAGWGPDADQYIANAVRKIRAVLRTRKDTLALRLTAPELFQDPVESKQADGGFPWGDFPWGGGTLVSVGNIVIPCAVSALWEVEDDAVAKAIGAFVATDMLRRDQPHMFA